MTTVRNSNGRSGGALLIAAFSGRALAAAARRAGYLPLVADLFGDADMRALAGASVRVDESRGEGFRADSLKEALARLSAEAPPVGFVYGAGFEAEPGLLRACPANVPVLGNDPEAIRRVKNPAALAEVCARVGIPHPEISLTPPSERDNWLIKQAGSAGGAYTRFWRQSIEPTGRSYWQRQVAGTMLSALFLANAEDAAIVGFSEQWVSPAIGAPFRFGGAASCEPPPDLEAALFDAVRKLTREFGLRGLNSADFIVDGSSFWLIEVNPRPGATLDLFDFSDAPLLAAHIAAVGGDLPRIFSHRGPARALAIAYASSPAAIPDSIVWPDWAVDLPAPGTLVQPGNPIVTVFAEARTTDAARNLACQRAQEIAARLSQLQPSACRDQTHVCF